MYFVWSGIIRSVIMGECLKSGRKHILSVQVTEEDHKLIIHGILREIEIKDNSEIPDVIFRMTETVENVDRWMNINRANCTTPLKKTRNITRV